MTQNNKLKTLFSNFCKCLLEKVFRHLDANNYCWVFQYVFHNLYLAYKSQLCDMTTF